MATAVGITLTVSLFYVVTEPRSTLVHRAEQPPTAHYPDGRVHYLGLYHDRTLLSDGSYRLDVGDLSLSYRSYRLVVGSDPSLNYGYGIDISPIDGSLGIRVTDWTASGVRVHFTTGHELFVPAFNFIGGR